MRLADTARAMLADALWTGVAIRKYAGPVPVDMRCMYFGGSFVTAMPINPWSKVKDVLTMLDMLCTTSSDMSMLFEGSKMHVWGVRTIPIRTIPIPTTFQSRCSRGWLRPLLGCITSIQRASCRTISVPTRDLPESHANTDAGHGPRTTRDAANQV